MQLGKVARKLCRHFIFKALVIRSIGVCHQLIGDDVIEQRLNRLGMSVPLARLLWQSSVGYRQ